MHREASLVCSGSGGCCDCGDPLAWRASGFCKRHWAPDPSLDPASLLQQDVRERAAAVLDGVCAFVLHAMTEGDEASLDAMVAAVALLQQVGAVPPLRRLIGNRLQQAARPRAGMEGSPEGEESMLEELMRRGVLLPEALREGPAALQADTHTQT